MQVITRAVARTLVEVRLVGEGSNEIVSAMDALQKAEDIGLDLILVSDKSTPFVVRIEDFKKIQYEEKKAKAKHAKGSELKEIQLKVNITDHDLATKVNAIERFLARGDKVKVTVRLKGRERDSPERAEILMGKVSKMVVCKISRLGGPMVGVILEPTK